MGLRILRGGRGAYATRRRAATADGSRRATHRATRRGVGRVAGVLRQGQGRAAGARDAGRRARLTHSLDHRWGRGDHARQLRHRASRHRPRGGLRRRERLGNQEHTLSALFGGSAGAQAAHDPAKLLADRRYKGFTGWFAAGAADTKKQPVAAQLAAASKKAGITVHTFTGVGGHNWQFASEAFRRVLAELCRELGVKG